MKQLQQDVTETAFDTWMGKIPGRLDAKQTAGIIGFQVHDVPVLVKAKLLSPLGSPSEKATKYFAAVQVFECAGDPKWLGKATKVIADHWKK